MLLQMLLKVPNIERDYISSTVPHGNIVPRGTGKLPYTRKEQKWFGAAISVQGASAQPSARAGASHPLAFWCPFFGERINALRRAFPHAFLPQCFIDRGILMDSLAGTVTAEQY